MRLLLDTHTFVWAVGQPTKLSKRAAAALRSPENELSVSAVSVWELATKYRMGRLPEAEFLLANLDEVLGALGADSIAMDSQDAMSAGTMVWEHRDPFDRMLAVQALRLNVSLVSRDGAFKSVRGLKLLW